MFLSDEFYVYRVMYHTWNIITIVITIIIVIIIIIIVIIVTIAFCLDSLMFTAAFRIRLFNGLFSWSYNLIPSDKSMVHG